MKKILLTFLSVLMFSTSAFAFPFFKKKADISLQTVPLFNSESVAENKVWAGTFELVWNELMDEVVKAPVSFADGDNAFAEEFNKQNFKKDYLSEKSYYTAHGFMTKTLKSSIEKALLEKFNDKSDILDSLSWSDRNFLVYAMLKKDFEFITAFKELKNDKFANKGKKIKYFGIERKGAKDARDSVRVLFYNSPRDFAVSVATKADDRLILYRTDDNSSFENMYADILSKSVKYDGNRSFTQKDRLKVPFIEFKTSHSYDELSKKKIANTDFVIDQAIQTIDFKMDNKGVKLKSEGALVMQMSFMPVEKNEYRNFYFDDTFVLYLIEKEKPYFALRVANFEGLKK